MISWDWINSYHKKQIEKNITGLFSLKIYNFNAGQLITFSIVNEILIDRLIVKSIIM